MSNTRHDEYHVCFITKKKKTARYTRRKRSLPSSLRVSSASQRADGGTCRKYGSSMTCRVRKGLGKVYKNLVFTSNRTGAYRCKRQYGRNRGSAANWVSGDPKCFAPVSPCIFFFGPKGTRNDFIAGRRRRRLIDFPGSTDKGKIINKHSTRVRDEKNVRFVFFPAGIDLRKRFCRL